MVHLYSTHRETILILLFLQLVYDQAFALYRFYVSPLFTVFSQTCKKKHAPFSTKTAMMTALRTAQLEKVPFLVVCFCSRIGTQLTSKRPPGVLENVLLKQNGYTLNSLLVVVVTNKCLNLIRMLAKFEKRLASQSGESEHNQQRQ